MDIPGRWRPATPQPLERGTATLEAALVVGLLLMLALGAFEYGMALQDWLSVASSSREGARVAGAAGDDVNGDCLILEATAGALFDNLANEEVAAVTIFESDTSGAHLREVSYRPVRTGDTVDLTCIGSWSRLASGFPTSDRTEGRWIGVEVSFDHQWITGFLWWNGAVNWSESTVMRIEPRGS